MAHLDLDEVLLALRGILLSVSGLPADRVFDDTYAVVGSTVAPYQPKVGVSYLIEQFVPGPSALITNLPCGLMTDTGLYFSTWLGITGQGGKAIRDGTRDIKAAFTPGRTVILASGNRLRIGISPAPSAGQILPIETGHSYCQVTVPYEVDWNLS